MKKKSPAKPTAPAAAAPLPDPAMSTALARILRPQAAYRWLLPQLSAITPQYIEQVLRSALAGNHVQQWELFDLMFDTWPELAACGQELTDGVMERKLIFEAFCEEDEDATPTAQERCKLASAALRRMRPEATADENDLDGTIKDILDGWFRGVTCMEIDWQMASSTVHGQFIAPRATFWVHPVCFAFDVNGRIGLRVDAAGQMQPMNLMGTSLQPKPSVVGAFPAHKFLIGIHKAKSGTALGGSILRPLAWWWCAANFGADWLLNLAQVFGLPFRWANYDPHAPQATVDAICTMLQNMGSAGWAAFPAGTTLELKEATSEGGDHSPQGELLDRADRYARLIILGQTMSGSQDSSKGGGKAFGEVESDVKAKRINAAAKYACGVLNAQFIPSILTLNYGDADEAPCVRLLEDEEGDLDQAQRDQVLASAGLEIPKSFLRKKYGLPAPTKGEETIGGEAEKNAESPKAQKKEDNDELEARCARTIAGIEDDALFAKELKAFADVLHCRYDPTQSRNPSGSEGGGRWASTGASPSKGESAKRGTMRTATQEDRKRMGIAPAWKDAMVTDDPQADLAATAVNAKGKTVYIYSKAYSESQKGAKFARIAALHHAMPGIQAQIDRDIMSGGKDKEQALAMRMVTLTGMRNGGDEGSGKVEAFGVSNLLTAHCTVEGNEIYLDFVGKKGVRQRHSLEDERLASHIVKSKESGAEQVFGGNAAKTLGYLKKISGDQFKVHDFRTWHGTMLADAVAAKIAARGETPSTAKEFKTFQTRVAKVVARQLGNDPAMALKAYIHPQVFTRYTPEARALQMAA